jgi:hypothetical protein
VLTFNPDGTDRATRAPSPGAVRGTAGRGPAVTPGRLLHIGDSGVTSAARPPSSPSPGEEDPEGALVLAWLATKRSPHTRATYLRDLAQQAGCLAGHGWIRRQGGAARDGQGQVTR